MILSVHLAGVESYDVGDEIWQEALADVIRLEADMIASYADAQVLGAATRLCDRIIEMTAALASVGDSYQAADGVVYSLPRGACFRDRRPCR
jgi:predicted trehalose synthase